MTRPDRGLSLLVMALPAMALLAACSVAAVPSAVPSPTAGDTAGPSANASPSPGASAGTLDGKTYLSTSVTGATLVPGSRISLSFDDGSVNANGGCNSMGGTATIEDGRLKTTALISTDMGCAQPLMQQDRWLAGLLGDSAITIAGDEMTLDDGTIKVTFLDREVADPRPSARGHEVGAQRDRDRRRRLERPGRRHVHARDHRRARRGRHRLQFGVGGGPGPRPTR